ncbi:MAG: hypothetical protein V7K61_30620 [Nostoc sp.]
MRAREVAQAVVFLCSDATSYITGQPSKSLISVFGLFDQSISLRS